VNNLVRETEDVAKKFKMNSKKNPLFSAAVTSMDDLGGIVLATAGE
jgi:hypothetical protein